MCWKDVWNWACAVKYFVWHGIGAGRTWLGLAWLAWTCYADNLMVELNQDIAWSSVRVHSFGNMNIELVLSSKNISGRKLKKMFNSLYQMLDLCLAIFFSFWKNLLGTKPPSILEFACVVCSMAWIMDFPKPPALLQGLVLLGNGDLRHKQRAHVNNPYYVCSAK